MNRLIISIIYRTLLAIALLLPAMANAQIDTRQVLRIGQNAMYFEDYVLSIQYFNQAIRSKPHLAEPYLLRAIAKFNLEDYAGAEADAAKAIEINPFLADAWEVRGVSRQNMGKNDQAIEDYKEALNALPRNRQIMFNMSMAYGAKKDYEKADSAFSLLISYYPGFDNAHLGRAMIRLEKNDTVAAMADVDKALQLNPNNINGHLVRSEIAYRYEKDNKKALLDIDQAVKLRPKDTNLYINRAFLRYNDDDYFGAMADYTYALQLEPLNETALFNRALLRTEVSDFDNALADYNQILEMDPTNDLALYNRAVIYSEKGDYTNAIKDIDVLIEQYPGLGAPYFMRSEWYKAMGNIPQAKADYEKGDALVSANRPITKVKMRRNAFDVASADTTSVTEEMSQEEFADRFNQLLTVDNETKFQEEYNNTSIRGKVQDRDINIETEPMMELSYYFSPTELRTKTYYIKEVDDLNSSRILRNPLLVTNRIPAISDENTANQHFSSIEYFNSYISTHTPRAIDYIGRAMDFITVKNYASAIEDLGRAIELTPDHPVAYFMRAQARYHNTLEQSKSMAYNLILADLDRTIELSPRNAIAWFNKGVILFEQGDYTSALSAYTKAIELQPDMGEAYYNRGYIYLKLGNKTRGIDDLGRAGEMGIVSAYNLIKRLDK